MGHRWQPSRAGIFNIWEYDDHVFEFGDGRLVLRGRNGSGKSNALTLLFPFLLDGVMSAWRMDPMGGARSMKSLLLGRDDDDRVGSYRHDSGTGYVWLELFDGDSHLTIGVGASATVHRDADAWFFVTPRRVNLDLDLAERDVPLSRRQLIERLGANAVVTSAEEHRAAVDRALFGLGESRYRTLIDLLITLRRPHLAGKLDTENLSQTLSAGLAELDPTLIDDVAHSFDDLDAMRHELEGLAESLDAVERFLPVYRDHLIGVARSRAAALITCTDALADLDVRRSAATAEREKLAERIRSIEGSIAVVSQQLSEVDTTIDAIRSSEAYRSVGALEEVRRSAEHAQERAASDSARADVSEDAVTHAAGAVETAELKLEKCRSVVAEAIDDWVGHARAAGLAPLPVRPERQDFDAVAAAAAVVERRTVLGELVALAGRVASAEAEVVRAEAALHQRRDELARAVQGRDLAHEVLVRELAELTAARGRWSDSLSQLLARFATRLPTEVPPDPLLLWDEQPHADGGDDDVRAELPGRPPRAPAGALDAFHRVDRLFGELDTSVARALDAATSLVEDQRWALDELTDERVRVESEPNPGPPPNATRPDAAEPERAGAPLYVCVDFAEGVEDAARAGLEAALAGSGLLDARITPGTAPDEALDATVTAPRADTAPSGATLADVLVPVAVDGLDAATIGAALASIPLEDGVVALRHDGRWRLGPLAGRFAQDEPRFIGHAARERRRQRRLAELDARIAAEGDALALLESDLAELADLRGELRERRGDQPSTAAVDAAGEEVRTAQARVEHAEGVIDAAEAELTATTSIAEGLTSDLHRRAVAANLPHDLAGLERVRSALDQCDRAQDRVAERRETRAQAEAVLADATEAARGASERADTDRAAARASAELAAQERRRHEELRDSVGQSAQDAADRLGQAERERTRLRTDAADARRKLETARSGTAALVERLEQLEQRRTEAVANLDAATNQLTVVMHEEIAQVLGLDGVTADAAPTDAARAVLAHSDAPAEDATNRMERAHREILLDGLHAGHDPSMPKLDGIDVVRVGTAEGEVPIGTLARQLRADHERTSQLLTDKERSIFETHLLSRVGDALRQLLFDADAFQHRINTEMADAPTESGMVVELQWEVDGDEPGLRDAVALLRQTPAMLSSERRDQLQQFFLSRIEELRSTDPGRSFAETLTTALDYRSWHRFVLFARFADGKRQRVTRTFFKSLSGGEAASLLHLPLFASAAAHYSSGSIDGPRLIALDEAFVGIDDQMRARLMGLLRQLDLDVILTSHEFWGFYDTVPSLVVYDLKRKPPAPGVYAQRFDWVGDAG
jgi:uncharacterized protein (TIGR02680 family)